MKTMMAFVFLVASMALLVDLPIEAQQKGTPTAQSTLQKTPPTVQPIQSGQPPGKVQTVPAAKLPKFKDAVKTPPSHTPPKKDGGSWHWHPHHGWVFLAIGVAPATVVLPVNYVLPASVTVYEVYATPVLVVPQRAQLVCPCCGCLVTVQLPK